MLGGDTSSTEKQKRISAILNGNDDKKDYCDKCNINIHSLPNLDL